MLRSLLTGVMAVAWILMSELEAMTEEVVQVSRAKRAGTAAGKMREWIIG